MDQQLLSDISELVSVKLLKLAQLKPHEKFCHSNFEYWLEHIRKAQFWSEPILVERQHKIIMDGHHRYQIALALKLKYIPCIVTSYANQFLSVAAYRNASPLSSEQIINAATCGILMEKKSSRHQLAFKLPQIHITLAILQ